ncbi:MAG: Rrf2 family transcriptional regulator [Alphaproteobacteria bacterium]|nr:Rrf2 family transcriptional regulator [Alphaproteobacteria bacterium]
MLRLPRKTRFALEAVVDIAYNARPEPVQSKEITRRQGIPQRYLEQVMQHLVRAGILKGVRGPRGGYTLARERRRISVGEVVRTIESMEQEPDEEAASSSSELGEKVLNPMFAEIQETVMSRLDAVTLEELCGKALALGVEKIDAPKADFTI